MGRVGPAVVGDIEGETARRVGDAVGVGRRGPAPKDGSDEAEKSAEAVGGVMPCAPFSVTFPGP